MKVVHVAFECAPIYKTGGLGDVVGSLPKTLAQFGVEIIIMLPKYTFIRHPRHLPDSKVKVYYIEADFLGKEITRHEAKITAPAFGQFCLGVLEKLRSLNYVPDIIHCHDWHAALIPLVLKNRPDQFFANTRTILTIHNSGFQGRFSLKFLKTTKTAELLNYISGRKQVSFLKEGIKNADFITTVSPHHAIEIRRGKVNFGLRSAIKSRRKRFLGILNGLDNRYWSPIHDRYLYKRYSKRTVFRAKKINKHKLQKNIGLPVVDVPLFGYVARLTAQKGVEYLFELIDLLSPLGIQLVVLGKGERHYEKLLKRQSQKNAPHFSFHNTFNEALAHQIYAGSDFLLIPSSYEPCGLTQLIAMRYGTIPVAANVGGLVDTIEHKNTGYLFESGDTLGFIRLIKTVINYWKDNLEYRVMVKRIMKKDFSWTKSARLYMRLYSRVTQL